MVLTAGCSAHTKPESSAAEPITVSNCGREVSVDGPPQRVYAAYQPAAEMAHALGLSDRLVGSAFFDGQMLPEYAGGQEGVPYSENLPTREALLATEPDFVFGGYGTVFADDTPNSVGSRQSLSELGIQSYVLTPFCPSEDGRNDQAVDPANVRVDAIYDDLRNLGELFGVQDRAQQITADMQARIAAVEEAVGGAGRPSVAFVQPQGDGTYQVSGALDFGTQIVEHAGGVNAFADITDTRNAYVDAETILRRDPDVILTASGYGPTFTVEDAAPDVETIVDNPAFAGLRAVQNNAVHPFLFADRSAGVRTAHEIELVASLIHPDLVK
ncbi:ABC transporter substrate-binding protein [Mycobacterium sp. WMMD1722]|uniref:ABC transporter substrate-binding protein n=1 Tax=Mycobacterium sp. WMMD1722 TaxID=3404117 RepID=UPI003BF5613E